jgi:hypothetical protein
LYHCIRSASIRVSCARRIHGEPSHVCGKPTDPFPKIDRTAREQIESSVSRVVPLEGVAERLKAGNRPEGFAALFISRSDHPYDNEVDRVFRVPSTGSHFPAFLLQAFMVYCEADRRKNARRRTADNGTAVFSFKIHRQ